VTFREEFLESVDLAGPEQAALLEQADQTLRELETMKKRVARDGVMVKGSRGALTAHPLLKEIRAHRAAFAALVKVLSPEDRPHAGAGTAAARSLAKERWSR
jgi:hypothetical protein